MKKDGSTGASLTTKQVAAGFASPADEFIEGQLDLNELLVKHPAATYFMKSTGRTAMAGGIFPDDILVVDRSLEFGHRAVVVAVINGELTVRRLVASGKSFVLRTDDEKAPEIRLSDAEDVEIWGVVRAVVRNLVR